MDLTKNDLIEEIYSWGGSSRKGVTEAVNHIFDKIEKTLAEGGKVRIHDFGSFTVGHRAERRGINPQTGDTITIPARNVVKFKPYSKLKDAVN